MKTLNLTFKGSLGKTHTLKLNYASDGLSKELVQASMDKIAATKLFIKEGEILYAIPVSAKYVTTTENVVLAKPAA
ncbi:MAG TPA: DUF2922 domain-containing protein [Candidatus Limosilactobacillus faecipullorum]|nr:DUF2922 domain-containing protein [Candidatus Limosilactobacillus faecipullorum]